MKRIALLFALALSFALVAYSFGVMQLREPALAGATSISLTEPVKPGKLLIIVGSEEEEMVTAGVGVNPFTPSVTPPLQHNHTAGASVLER